MKTIISVICVTTLLLGVYLSTKFAGSQAQVRAAESSWIEDANSVADAVTYDTTSFAAPSFTNVSAKPPVQPFNSTSNNSFVAIGRSPINIGGDAAFAAAPTPPEFPAIAQQKQTVAKPANPGFSSRPNSFSTRMQPKRIASQSTAGKTEVPIQTGNFPHSGFSHISSNMPQGFNQAAPARKSTNTIANQAWPNNAQNVARLYRTEYELPKSAAESIVEFFSSEGNQKIETVVKSDDDSPLVTLVVTTDEVTQRTIASFLNAVYPADRIQFIKLSNEDVESAAATPAAESSDPESELRPSIEAVEVK